MREKEKYESPVLAKNQSCVSWCKIIDWESRRFHFFPVLSSVFFQFSVLFVHASDHLGHLNIGQKEKPKANRDEGLQCIRITIPVSL
jgi:hypothetical protein